MNKKRYQLSLALSILIITILACGGSNNTSREEAAEAPPVAQQQEKESEQAVSAPTATPIPEPTNTPAPTNTPEPTPTPTPLPIGLSRSNPFPSSDVVSAPNWDVQILEAMRGDAAWQAIQAANQFNEPAPEGMEYLLVKLHVKNTYTDNEEHSIGGGDFKVTGDRLIEYFGASVVEPDPHLTPECLAEAKQKDGLLISLVKVKVI